MDLDPGCPGAGLRLAPGPSDSGSDCPLTSGDCSRIFEEDSFDKSTTIVSSSSRRLEKGYLTKACQMPVSVHRNYYSVIHRH